MPPLLNTTYWLFTKTKLKNPTITLHAEGCPILRLSRRRTLGVLSGPLTWAEIAALPDKGYPCGRCKPTPRPLQGPRRRPGKESPQPITAAIEGVISRLVRKIVLREG
jgi:hypothetical protein